MAKSVRSIYADIYVKGSHRAKTTPRVSRAWRPRMIAWAGPAAFYPNRFYDRDKWYKARIQKPEKYPKLHLIDPDDYMKSLGERLDDETHAMQMTEKVNIGFEVVESRKGADLDELNKYLEMRPQLESASRRKQLLIDLEKLSSISKLGQGARRIIEHYGIFADLFHPDCYFDPALLIDIHYDIDESTLASVHLGNTLTPTQTHRPPRMTFDGGSDSFWTLLMVNPDGNPFHENKEIVQWLVGNIPNSDVTKGEPLFDYLPPIPFKGTGWHRFVFLLFKQHQKLDFHRWACREASFEARSFSTAEFYKNNEDSMTPAGLAFFQAEWDQTCHKCLYDRFGAKHPLYRYTWSAPLKAAQEEFPDKPQPFDLYLDQYRHGGDVHAEMIKKRLAMSSVSNPPEPEKYPDIFWMEHKKSLPQWKHARNVRENQSEGETRAIWENPID